MVDHHTWVFLGILPDGRHLARNCSLARLRTLGPAPKLIAFYDDNGISIDGDVEGWFTDDTVKRFEAYGWQVIPAIDGHDCRVAPPSSPPRRMHCRPTLICCRTKIGKGAPNKEGGHDVHGAPLGDAEIAATRAHLNWPHAPFEIPVRHRQRLERPRSRRRAQAEWTEHFAAYRAAFPAEAAEFERRMRGELPANWAAHAACD
ncbi:MAG: hypothetical protein U1E47_07235 [Rivihabitans pingtungensis]